MPLTVSRTRRGMSMYSLVVISPATTTRPVVISVSHATRLAGSRASAASSTASEIWSAILSGCPSVTDSDVKRKLRAATGEGGYPTPLRRLQVRHERLDAAVARPEQEQRAERPEVRLDVRRQLLVRELREAGERRQRVLRVDEQEALRVVR